MFQMNFNCLHPQRVCLNWRIKSMRNNVNVKDKCFVQLCNNNLQNKSINRVEFNSLCRFNSQIKTHSLRLWCQWFNSWRQPNHCYKQRRLLIKKIRSFKIDLHGWKHWNKNADKSECISSKLDWDLTKSF